MKFLAELGFPVLDPKYSKELTMNEPAFNRFVKKIIKIKPELAPITKKDYLFMNTEIVMKIGRTSEKIANITKKARKLKKEKKSTEKKKKFEELNEKLKKYEKRLSKLEKGAELLKDIGTAKMKEDPINWNLTGYQIKKENNNESKS